MTVPINDRRIQYVAIASQTIFPYDFEIFSEQEIEVIKTIAATGASETLILTNDYTVTNVGNDNGGDIVLNNGAAENDVITITGKTLVERNTDFNQAGNFLMSDLNDQLDRLTRISQESSTSGSRAVTLKDADTATSLQLPITSERISKFLAFDSNGEAIASPGSVDEVPTTDYTKTFLESNNATEAKTILELEEGSFIYNLSSLSGIGNAYTATIISYITYQTDDKFSAKININNTGASTLSINGLSNVNIKKYNVSGVKIDLEANDLIADDYANLVYDGTDFILQNPKSIYFNNINIKDIILNNTLNIQPNAATISGGAITYTGAYMVIDTEGGAATDDLETINGGNDGNILIIRTTNNARDITVKHGTGNIVLKPLEQDVFLDFENDRIVLQYKQSNNSWEEVSRSVQSDFANSTTTNQESTNFPNGWIIKPQNGYVSTIDGAQSFSFAAAFPNRCFAVIPSIQGVITAISTTGFTFDRDNGLNGSFNFQIIAIGY
jgi:hypothetical protein